MDERTETDVILAKPVVIEIDGQLVTVKPAKGAKWLECMERLADLVPIDEVKDRIRIVKDEKGNLVRLAFDYADLEGMAAIVKVFVKNRNLSKLWAVLVDAMGQSEEEAKRIRENASPEEMLLAAREVAPILFPLDRLGEMADAMGLTEETEETEEAGKAPKPKTAAV